ncbi:MAG: hypothetical protein ACYCWE_03925 [Eubacteriales bacterium]
MLIPRFRLYKKPFITSVAFLITGFVMTAGGFILADYTGTMDYYAMAMGGFLVFIIGLIILILYGKLEKQYQNILYNNPLLHFTVDNKYLKHNIDKNIEDLKSQNKAILFVMLFFCVLVAVVLPFFFEDGYLFIFIGLGLGVFLTSAAIIITYYRINKLKNSTNEIILTGDSAYVGGEFHSWNMPGTSLTMINYVPPDVKKDRLGLLEITYHAVSYPAPLKQKINIPVPIDLVYRIPEVIQILQQKYEI